MTPKEAYNYLKDNKPQDKEIDYNNLFFLPITELYIEIYRTIMYSIPLLESILLKDPYWTLKYAKDVLKGRWIDGEKALLESKDPIKIYLYAVDVIKGRWPEGENILLESKDLGYIYWYTKFIMEERWRECENIILSLKDPEWIYYYAEDVIKGRWTEAESIILNSSYCKEYKEKFNLP